MSESIQQAVQIKSLHARQILDSRGNPTVEVDVTLTSGAEGRASVPSGASTGVHEVHELRDGGEAWNGRGVGTACSNVEHAIADSVTGRTFASHADVDAAMIEVDGTTNKSKLGANAILGVSLALARALANEQRVPLWKWIGDVYPVAQAGLLPCPMLNILNGGAHANNGLDVQEFMVVPHGFDRFTDALEAAARTFAVLKRILGDRKLSTAVGDEGGFAPVLASNTAALELICEAIDHSGFEPGRQLSVALDVASSELVAGDRYNFAGDGEKLTSTQLIARYDEWRAIAPIVSIEDGMGEDDWNGWAELTQRMGDAIQLVGDDLFATNIERVTRGVESSVANAVLIKVNQIGSLSETIATMRYAHRNGYRNVISHRSGETEDPFIAHLAVGTGVGQIKTGAPNRSERVAKYNELLRIEETLADAARYGDPFAAAVSA